MRERRALPRFVRMGDRICTSGHSPLHYPIAVMVRYAAVTHPRDRGFV
jgi:hypothetical protein